MNAVDTNVLFYAHDPRDPRKQAIAEQLIEALDAAVLLWQVACEYMSASRKLAHLGYKLQDAEADLRELRLTWLTQTPGWPSLDRGLRIMGAFGLSFWDSLLVASATDAEVTRLYSEDFGNLNSIDGVQIVNPFA